ncbi:MAG: M56 family metallopeptidase [Evtepia gabavorous]
MDQILQTLLTMTTTASVAALCVMGLRLLLKRAPRWITCLLWMVVFVRMVCPVSFSLPVSLVPAPIAQGTYVQQAGQALEASSRAQAPAPADTGGPADQGASAGPDRTDVVVGLWGAGTLGMLLWGGVSYLRLRRRTGEAIRLEGNLYETDQIAAPFVCGVFSPKIYLPVGLDPQDRPYVLLHEQAHLRRRDHLTKPLAWLALCLHWCNPLLWLAYRLFCRDLETACDQAVIRRFGAKDTAQYAAALLHLGHSGKLPQRCPWPLGRRTPRDASGTYWTINGPRSGWQGSRCWCVRPPSS